MFLRRSRILDLVQIWRYLKKQGGVAIADRVESVIRDKIVFLQETPAPDIGARI